MSPSVSVCCMPSGLSLLFVSQLCLYCVLDATRAPELIAPIQNNTCVSTRCATECFRSILEATFHSVPWKMSLFDGSRVIYTQQIEPDSKADTETAERVRSFIQSSGRTSLPIERSTKIDQRKSTQSTKSEQINKTGKAKHSSYETLLMGFKAA